LWRRIRPADQRAGSSPFSGNLDLLKWNRPKYVEAVAGRMDIVHQKRKLIILGAGNFAEEALDLARETGRFDVVCFVEGIDREQCNKQIAGVPIAWIEDLRQYDRSHALLCAVGSPRRRHLIAQAAETGLEFVNLVHPSARISATAQLGSGILVSTGVIIAAGTSVGDHVMLNRGALIGHNVTIADYVTISPGVNIGGRARIGEGTYVGMGAIILDHLLIGRNSIVGAGAVVTKTVPDNVQVLGVPATITRQLTEEV
jgi:sugar O-acyltransferase (sialic acid O-acetyltransferase NeuD family)